MKVGLLNAISPDEEVSLGLYELPIFQSFLDQVPAHDLELVEYRITENQFPASPDECDAYLISGSPRGVYDDNAWIAQLGNFIRACYAAEQKMVGICFGHQILAHSLGGVAEKAEAGWGLGLRRIEVQQPQTWMSPPLKTGGLYYCHQDQVMKLPDSATLLASDPFCPNAMFTLENRVLGIQGHPEFTKPVMANIVNDLDREIAPTVRKEAQNSLNREEADSNPLAQWIVNFLQDDS